jgi:hypothetical protein
VCNCHVRPWHWKPGAVWKQQFVAVQLAQSISNLICGHEFRRHISANLKTTTAEPSCVVPLRTPRTHLSSPSSNEVFYGHQWLQMYTTCVLLNYKFCTKRKHHSLKYVLHARHSASARLNIMPCGQLHCPVQCWVTHSRYQHIDYQSIQQLLGSSDFSLVTLLPRSASTSLGQ